MAPRLLRVPLPAVVLVGTGVASSYHFYHVNNLKLLVLAIGIATLVLARCLAMLRGSGAHVQPVAPWPIWALLSLPVLGTAPGYLLHVGMTHYYLPVELATNLLLILWTVLLYGWLRDRRGVAGFIVGAGVSVASVSILAILEGAGLRGGREGVSEDPRVLGTFGSPNVLAAFLIPLLSLFLVYAGRNLTRGSGPGPQVQPREGRGKKPERRRAESSYPSARRHFGWALGACVLFFLGAIALFLSQSRMGIFAWCAAGGLAVVLCYRGEGARGFSVRPSRQAIVTLALIAVGAALGLTVLKLQKDSAYEFYEKRVAAVTTFRGWSSRMVPWDAAIRSIRASPLVGHGLGTSYELFFEHVSPLSRAYAEGRSFAHAHSEVLETLQEGGILAALMTLALFVSVIRAAVRGWRRGRGDPLVRDLCTAVLAGILGYALCAAITESSRMVGSKLALYTLFAIALSLPNLESRGKRERGSPKPPARPPEPTALEDPVDGRSHQPLEETMRRTSGTGARLLLPQCVMVIALLAAAFGVLVPHLRSMRLWAEMAARPMSEPLMLRIDAAMKRNANPYCLFYLLDWQVKSGRYAEARETLKRLDFLIPHYRERDYLEALLAVKETDIERARRLGLATMDRDRYYQPNLALLTTIGAAVRDTSLVFSALMAMSEWAAIRSGFSWRGREEIDVSADPSIEGIEIRHAAGGTQVVWSDALVDGIYRWRTATLRGWDTATQNRFRSWLDKEFSVREVADVTRSTEVTDRFSELLQSGLIRLVQ